ncbi:MAG: pilus assembly protein N-terminal domain-containing protein [Beijerinckiaceae bacterium]
MCAWYSIGSWLRDAAKPLLLLCCICATPGVAAPGETLLVKVDQAQPVKVPAGTQTLIIGNPTIADVTLVKQGGVMVVTGKGYGETNLIALDAAGDPVAEKMIKVVAGDDALIVQRGLDRQSYTCAPRCQPTVRLGDETKYFGEVAAQVQAHNAQASGK